VTGRAASAARLRFTFATMPVRVSVLMPAYNTGRFIREAIASVLAQRDIELELIVIDDGSTDDTGAIASAWAAIDPRLQLLRLATNCGASFALNAGLDRATGEYIARHDSDDLAMPGRFASQAAVLDAEPALALVGTNYVTIDASGRPLARINRAESPSVLAYLMNFGNPLGIGGNAMFRRAMVRSLGGFSREFRVAQGFELWARLSQHGAVKVLPSIGVHYRVHDASTSRRKIEEQKVVAREICRRVISSNTGRTISPAEAEGVLPYWWGFPRPQHPEAADRLMIEAFEAFRGRNPPRTDVERVRVINSGRFARAAIMLARGRYAADAARCVRIAGRWHPSGHPGVALGALKSMISSAQGRHRA
jgi:glycosyltransferase involved in cell wall biosynthesis